MAVSQADDLLLPRFDFESEQASDGSKWEEFLLLLENQPDKAFADDDERKKATLLSHVDDITTGVVRALSLQSESYLALKRKLQSYFVSPDGSLIRMFVFRNEKQQHNEALSDFCARLQCLAKRCFFKEEEKEVILQVILGCHHDEIRQKVLWDTDSDLDLPGLVAMETPEMRDATQNTVAETRSLTSKLFQPTGSTAVPFGCEEKPEEESPHSENSSTAACSAKDVGSSDVTMSDAAGQDNALMLQETAANHKACQTEEVLDSHGGECKDSEKQAVHRSFFLAGGKPVSLNVSLSSAAGVEAIDEERFCLMHSKSPPVPKKSRRKRRTEFEGGLGRKRRHLENWQASPPTVKGKHAEAEENWDPIPPKEKPRGDYAGSDGEDEEKALKTDAGGGQESQFVENAQQPDTQDDDDGMVGLALLQEDWGREPEGNRHTDGNGASKKPSSRNDRGRWNERERGDKMKAHQGRRKDQPRFEHKYDSRSRLPWNYIDESENFVLFFRKYSPFSQHHPCQFWLENRRFNCTEQYMMYMKAVVAEDYETGEAILSADCPARQKRLGSSVRGLDKVHWGRLCEDIVYRANWAKFSQNAHLREVLLGTRPKVLVEANPSDSQWGVGLAKDDPRAWCMKTWRGANRLGFLLMQVREALASETQQTFWPQTPADHFPQQTETRQWTLPSDGQQEAWQEWQTTEAAEEPGQQLAPESAEQPEEKSQEEEPLKSGLLGDDCQSGQLTDDQMRGDPQSGQMRGDPQSGEMRDDR